MARRPSGLKGYRKFKNSLEKNERIKYFEGELAKCAYLKDFRELWLDLPLGIRLAIGRIYDKDPNDYPSFDDFIEDLACEFLVPQGSAEAEQYAVELVMSRLGDGAKQVKSFEIVCIDDRNMYLVTNPEGFIYHLVTAHFDSGFSLKFLTVDKAGQGDDVHLLPQE